MPCRRRDELTAAVGKPGLEVRLKSERAGLHEPRAVFEPGLEQISGPPQELCGASSFPIDNLLKLVYRFHA